jgi:hypothetical protein
MKLTDVEKQVIQEGGLVEFREDGIDCVILRADLFERYRREKSEALASETVTYRVNDAMTDSTQTTRCSTVTRSIDDESLAYGSPGKSS